MPWTLLLALACATTPSPYTQKVALLEQVPKGADAAAVEAVLGAPACILRKSSPTQNLFYKGDLEPRLQSGWIYTFEADAEHTLEVLFDAQGLVVTTSHGVGGTDCDTPVDPAEDTAQCPDGTVTPPSGEVAGLSLATRHSPICSYPGILRDGVFQPLALPNVGQTGWVGLVGLGGGRFVGALDMVVEAPGWEVILVGTEDGGQTWSVLQTLRKPYYMATVTALTLDAASGAGALELTLDEDYGAGVAPGRYRAALSAGGAVASALELQPD